MPSTYSNLGLELQATGENSNTWGELTNVNLQRIDNAIAGYSTVQCNSTTITLTFSTNVSSTTFTDENGRNKVLKFTSGTAGAPIVVTVPDVEKEYLVENTSGQAITFTAGGSTTYQLATGKTAHIYIDGASAVYNALDNFVASTIDSAVIGGTDPAAGTFTNLTATGTLTGLLGNVVEDVTPQLGGDLDLNSNDITGTGNINITGNITASGNLTSLGIDDNATSTAITIGSDERVHINGTPPASGTRIDPADETSGLNIYKTTEDSSISLFRNDTSTVNGEIIGSLRGLVNDNNSSGFYVRTSEIDFIASATHSSTVRDTDIVFKTMSGTTLSQKMRIADDGDISFYEDTGTTPKFFWDASAERLGIGTSSPTALIHSSGTSIGTEIYGKFSTGSAVGDQNLTIQSNSGRSFMGLQVKTGGAVVQPLGLNPDGGNVSIGTDSPAFPSGTGLAVHDASVSRFKLTTNTSGETSTDGFEMTASGTEAYINNRENGNLILYTNSTEAMRLDSSQNLDMTNGGGNIILANGAGIDFSATAGTGTSELLDDYETGTFTVGTYGDATGVLSSESGEYTKIGNVVHVRIVMTVSTNFTGTAIDGLPFSADHDTSASSVLATNAFVTLSNTNGVIFGKIPNGGSRIEMLENNNFNDAHSPNTSNSTYRISLWYYSA